MEIGIAHNHYLGIIEIRYYSILRYGNDDEENQHERIEGHRSEI